MIVKNESHIIRQTLENITKYIGFDYYVVSDTGSTDNTKEIITDFFKNLGIPGEITNDLWKNFGHNRTIAFQHAYNKSDYVFVWDADDEIAGNFKMPTNLVADDYRFKFGGGAITYHRGQLFNNRKRWRYVGVLHEYANCLEPGGGSADVDGDYYFISNRKGDRSKDPLKYEKDAQILEEGYSEAIAEKDEIHMRYAFYCANSWRDANQPEKAIEWYKKVLTLANWSQEKYMSCCEIYDLSERLGRSEEGLQYLIESFNYDTTRVECALRLIKYYTIKKNDHAAYAYYTVIQPWYENRFIGDNISTRLFAKVSEYEFFLPYYMVIVSEKVRKYETGIKMFEIIAKQGANQGQWWLHNLFYNFQFYSVHFPKMAKPVEFLQLLQGYFDKMRAEGIQFKGQHCIGLQRLVDACRPFLVAPLALLPEFRKASKARILLTVTTCKRLDLFQQTMNSVLKTWKDIVLIDSFFCVDDNSSEEDRSTMKKLYPFFDFYMKTPAEKGHRESMNIIWRRIRDTEPTYWIHLEDDWLFYREDKYVVKSMKFLEKYAGKKINQILYNRNYAETLDGYDINGGTVLEGFIQHEKSDTIPGRNCGYWPHYSFRPSMTRVSTILELGNYDSPNTFFERDYADKYFANGYTSAFFDTVSSLHIGKLTSDKTGTNAYILNKEDQGLGAASASGAHPGGKGPQTIVLNLARRPDRRAAMEAALKSQGISANFYKAVDGKEVLPSEEIKSLFEGNDFGSRKGFIGCALSHCGIWKELLASEEPYMTVLEDDVDFVGENLGKYLSDLGPGAGSIDFLFLGYTMMDETEKDKKYERSFIELDKSKYLGGFFGYIITRQGAKKMLDYIKTNGIKHGIDYLVKIVPGLLCQVMQPHIVKTGWVNNLQSAIDSDIQKSFESLDFAEDPLAALGKRWVFFRELDSMGGDIGFFGKKSVEELVAIAGREGAAGFNTLGFLKKDIRFPLVPSPYVKGDDGLWVKRVRVKFLCNWQSSQALCEEWNKMSKGNYSWNAIQAVWEGEVDYYCILNRTLPGEFYVPSKTIIFHLEPWCSDPTQSWGVKTWGEFARPDLTKFFQVRTHPYAVNGAFWQTSWTYTDYMTKKICDLKVIGDAIGCVCTSKYFDPGHKKRIDFMKFVEAKADPGVQIDLYNDDNQHGFKNYKGIAKMFISKENGLHRYKYYFHCENNPENNFITEKLWEPLLAETLCFYWGAPNVAEVVDPRAFVQLDMNDFEGSFQTVKTAIANNLWAQRLPFIRREKQRVLDELGVFPALERAIFNNEKVEKKTACFIHCCNNPNGQGLEKLDLLLKTLASQKGLFDKIIINNTGPSLKAGIYSHYSLPLEIRQESENTQLFELPTLRLLHKFASSNPNYRILYLHTKSISYEKTDAKYANGLDWIQMMLYFLLEKSALCLERLETSDTVGCNYQDQPFKHYSGNFWWANASYVKGLDTGILKEKMDAEKWLCSSPSHKKSVAYLSGKNHFSESCKRNEYVLGGGSPNPKDTVLSKNLKCVSLFDKTLGNGLCNQLMSLLGNFSDGDIVVVNDFLKEIQKPETCPARDVLDLPAMSLRSGSIIMDNITYKINNIKYGTEEIQIDITQKCLTAFQSGKVFFMPKKTDINLIDGDPVPGQKKFLFLSFSVAGKIFENIFLEHGGLVEDLCINPDNLQWSFRFTWINKRNAEIFDRRTRSFIQFAPRFYEKVDEIVSRIGPSYSSIHLKNEPDSIRHYAKVRKMDAADVFKLFNDTYISYIKENIPINSLVVVLTGMIDNNPVIQYLQEKGYKIFLTEKSESRELNAIVDLILGSRTTDIYIGPWSPENLSGSSFSYTVSKLLGPEVKFVSMDLDRIGLKNIVIKV